MLNEYVFFDEFLVGGIYISISLDKMLKIRLIIFSLLKEDV